MASLVPELSNGETPKTVGQKCELRMEHARYDKTGKQEVLVYNGEPLDDSNLDDNLQYAIVARKSYTDKNQLDKSIVQINSPFLLKIFRTVVGSYPAVPSDFESPFEIESPFSLLHHYWDELHAFSSSINDDTARNHLNLLLDFMKTELGKEKAECDVMIKGNQILFSKLWAIFRPGDLQYHVVEGHPWLLRLKKTAYEETKNCGKFFEVHCTYTDFDGTIVGDASCVITIYQTKTFPAESMTFIAEIPIFPRRFLKNYDDLEEKLANRGSRCLDLQGTPVKNYDGLAFHLKSKPFNLFHPAMAEWAPVWLPFTETGRVVLDRKTFQEENNNGQMQVRACKYGKSPDPILCPPYVMGYSLARKEWCKFFVDMIYDIEWKKDAFESLIIKESQKKVLLPLISAHSFGTDVRDQTLQKGKGLVILLHGTPGSGKTLTAESAAEVTGKALLSTTLSELDKNSVPFMFENALKKVLEYATMWKAIVLLDEADVFLESRGHGQANSSTRNAVVAVFLRNLEYFSGIVFLTSNRVGVFDDAMKSRLHLAIEYSPPELDIRRIIWTQYLSVIPTGEREIDLEEDVITFSKDELNGREISYAVTTARTIARFEKRPLRIDDIETILQVRRDFEVSIAKKKALLVDGE